MIIAKSHMEKTMLSLAGEFLVAGQLCLKGYVASLTLKNYPGVDISCLNPATGKQVALQVKTKRGGNQYYVPENVDNASCVFVFVYVDHAEQVSYYILPASEVAAISEEERQSYLHNHPTVNALQPRMISHERLKPFEGQWDLLWQ